MQRQRKTKEPCQGCFLHLDHCMCHLIIPFGTKTKVSVLIHAKELKRTTNTGRIAVQALLNSSMHVRGQINTPLPAGQLLDMDYENWLFFPSADAAELTHEFVSQFKKPIHLIVPDGNWRQASKVHTRHLEFADLRRVKISTPNPLSHHLRLENTKEGMATLQAIAHALKFTESEAAFEKLNAIYLEKLFRTLKARGEKFSRESLATLKKSWDP